MRRRKFLGVLGGTAAWPIAVQAQRSAKPPTTGLFVAGTPSWEGIFVKPRIIYAALAVLALAVPAVAQVFEARALPPDEILTILYMAGLDPIGQPARSATNYVTRAIDG